MSEQYYYKIDREQWKTHESTHHIELTADELDLLKSLNDRISLQDVQDIYIPMIRLFENYWTQHMNRTAQLQSFLNQPYRTVPFIIGISGSVAVGKSTTARLLQTMLQQLYPSKTIDLVTTDGFLFPTQELKERQLLHRKGFPESYDMEKLVSFLLAIKTDSKPVKAPIYSHEIYDIVKDSFQLIHHPDVLIVEGINVLQLPPNRQIYVSDFFDWSIYVDAEPENIEKWYLERFELLMERAKTQPHNYYYEYAIGDRQQAIEMAREVWKQTNLKNLYEYILPTRMRADFILHKSHSHAIDYVLLKKY